MGLTVPHYSYPLFLHPAAAYFGSSAPVTVLDLTDEVVFFAREKMFKQGQIQVYKDRQRQQEVFRIKPVKGKQRQQQFIQIAKDMHIGGITERRGLSAVGYEISAQSSGILFVVHIDIANVARAAMKAFVSGRVNRVPPVEFLDRDGKPVASLHITNKRGGQRFELIDADIKPANEVRLLLSAITLMVWWDHDNSEK
jgi:hypothetical protein